MGRIRAALQVAIAAQDAARAQIARLSAGEAVPTDAALADERSRRDRAWAPVRDSYLEGSINEPPDERTDKVSKFDDAIATADRVADRKAVEAERIASLNFSEQALSEAEEAIAAVEAQLKELATTMLARVGEFDQSFPDLVGRLPTLPGIAGFLDRRADVQALQTTAQNAVTACQSLEAAIAPTLDLLVQAEAKANLAPPADYPVAARVQAAIEAIRLHDEAHGDYRRDLRDLDVDSQTLGGQNAELARLTAEEAVWVRNWPAAVAAIGLPPAVMPAGASKVVSEWMGAPGVLGMIAQTQRRLVRMDEDELALVDILSTLAGQILVTLPSDPIAATEMLHSLWDAADKVRQRRSALTPEVDALKIRVAARIEAFTVAQDATTTLAAKVGVMDDDDALKAAAAQFRRAADLAKTRAEAVRSITLAGDGLDVADLRVAWAQRDMDELQAELTVATDEATAIGNEIETAIEAVQARRTVLEGFETDTGVNHAVALRESAIAEIHATIERYLELTVAHEAITRAIAIIRNEQQDPLIRRAANFLALMTKGEFERIDTDIDDKGEPVVVGRRANGAAVAVSAMSDGVRDQLFLAFRLASIESYCRATEPLPFIADDILVHFDDPRSAATLDLLSEFAQTNQVLLFTHHLSVRDAAGALGQRAQVVELQ